MVNAPCRRTWSNSCSSGNRHYADHRASAVFVLLGSDQTPVGAELRGTAATSWRGLAAGSRKDLGYFSIPVPETTTIGLCGH